MPRAMMPLYFTAPPYAPDVVSMPLICCLPAEYHHTIDAAMAALPLRAMMMRSIECCHAADISPRFSPREIAATLSFTALDAAAASLIFDFHTLSPPRFFATPFRCCFSILLVTACHIPHAQCCRATLMLMLLDDEPRVAYTLMLMLAAALLIFFFSPATLMLRAAAARYFVCRDARHAQQRGV